MDVEDCKEICIFIFSEDCFVKIEVIVTVCAHRHTDVPSHSIINRKRVLNVRFESIKICFLIPKDLRIIFVDKFEVFPQRRINSWISLRHFF